MNNWFVDEIKDNLRRIGSSRPLRLILAGFFLSEIILLFIPLIRDLDYEFNEIIAVLMFVAAGSSTIIIRRIYTAGEEKTLANKPASCKIPGFQESIVYIMLMLLLSAFVVLAGFILKPCCYYRTFIFFITLPLLSALMGFSAGLTVSVLIRKRHYLSWFSFLILSFLYNIWLLIKLPAVYVYSVYWGYFAGPVYDDWIPIDGTFLTHRLITAVLAALQIFVALILYAKTEVRIKITRLFFCGLGVFAVALILHYRGTGFIRTQNEIEKYLWVHRTSGNIDWYFDPAVSRENNNYLALLGEYHYEDLARQMNLSNPEKMSVFVYRDPVRKKKLMGSGKTNIARIWNNSVHVNAQDAEGVIRHEMVHVLANDFGHPLFGSVSAALLEGLAVALETDHDFLTPHQWTHILILRNQLPDMKQILDQNVFFTSATHLRYTLAGSFCRYLIDHHGMENFKRAYRSADLEDVYQINFSELLAGWKQEVMSSPVDSADLALADILLQPSYSDRNCYHAVADRMMSARKNIRAGRYSHAVESLNRAAEMDPDYLPSRRLMLNCYTKQGEYAEALKMTEEILKRDRLHPLRKVEFQTLAGDLNVLLGHDPKAKMFYDLAGKCNHAFKEAYLEYEIKNQLMYADTGSLKKIILRSLHDLPGSSGIYDIKKDSLLNLWTGKLYYEKGLWLEAIRYLDLFAFTDPVLEFCRARMLTRCLTMLGQPQCALRYLGIAGRKTVRRTDLLSIHHEILFLQWMMKQQKGKY